ncbi:C40 family peptidase [Tepidibacter aestuarii]|uniref:C40 family peptidase n=1 Tax=Tepidibacter aestuarii TaxID=2925782 RepID=UPI0020BDE634|nr:C40 family peptidase [Tepidibacter aestuarii]CAH2214272.1 gamma-D-glutamyl-L-lysine dipeptidyl-peptidase [Tepidibacter aestuarii]
MANMKKIVAPALAMIISLTFNISKPSASTYEEAQINANNLNVRSENNLNANIITKVNSGQRYLILEEQEGWYKIKLNSSQEGWVSSQYSTKKQAVGVVNGNNVNVRSSNTTASDSIAILNTGNEVTILDKNEDWYKVQINEEQTGYIYHSLIDIKRDNMNVTRGSSDKLTKLYEVAQSKLGSKYVWASSGPNTFDCSGFTMYVYKNGAGIDLPHSSKAQSSVGTAVSKDQLRLGDLVFFDTSRNSSIGHVGMYIGNGNFIHASSAKANVMISSLSEGYYQKTYVTARRVIN